MGVSEVSKDILVFSKSGLAVKLINYAHKQFPANFSDSFHAWGDYLMLKKGPPVVVNLTL